MTRTLPLAILACVFACAWTAAPAYALSVPGMGKDKDKKKEKKEEKKDEQKTENKTVADDNKTAGGEQKPETADKKEEAPPAAGPVTLSEMTIGKEAWDVYKDFKTGTFVEYGMPAQPGMKMRYEVVETGENFVVIQTTTSGPGYSQKQKLKYVYKADTVEKVTVANKEFTATRTDMTTDGKLTLRSWTSKEIPQLMGGTVKTEDGNGKVSMILTDFSK